MFVDIETGYLAMTNFDSSINLIKKEVLKTKETQETPIEMKTTNEEEEEPENDFNHLIGMEIEQELQKIEEKEKNGEIEPTPKRKYRPRKPKNKYVLQNEFDKAKEAKRQKLLKLKAMQRGGNQLEKLPAQTEKITNSNTVENSKETNSDEIELLNGDDEDENDEIEELFD